MLFVAAPAFSANITIGDGSYRDPRVGEGQGRENNETEPGMTNSQIWDLEGFFFSKDSPSKNFLSVVGGYNFLDGQYSSWVRRNFMSGDIFISTREPNPTGSAPYGYDYVLDLDFSTPENLTYSAYALSDASTLIDPYFTQNGNSSPWQYTHGDELAITGYDGLSFNFSKVTSGSEFDIFGVGIHYALTGFDLSFLGHDTKFYSHFTMECGNDNLMGRGTVVPEPTTMILLGSGLVGLAFYRRKK